MRRIAIALALLPLAACATGPGHGGDQGPPIGAAARARHGADPVALPPADAGQADDPPGGPAPGNAQPR